MRKKTSRHVIGIALAAVAATALSAPAAADAVADFYKGKQLTILVGYGAGGGYDTTARAYARHLGRHIPGSPTVIVQNMPGAGSMRSVNYLYNAAPRDGTVLATFASSAAMEPLYGNPAAKFETAKFEWIGSFHQDVQACAVWKGAGQGIRTLPDLIAAKETVLFGGTAASSPLNQYPLFVKNMFNANVRVIDGYEGTRQINLAMQQGELHGTCGMFESSVRSAFMHDFQEGNLNLFMQVGRDRKIEFFGEATRVYDLLETDEQRRIAEIVFRPSEITRPLAAPPGTPKDRVAALRKAMLDTAQDPQLIAEAKKIGVEFVPMTGEEVEETFATLFSQPPELAKKAYEMMTTK